MGKQDNSGVIQAAREPQHLLAVTKRIGTGRCCFLLRQQARAVAKVLVGFDGVAADMDDIGHGHLVSRLGPGANRRRPAAGKHEHFSASQDYLTYLPSNCHGKQEMRGQVRGRWPVVNVVTWEGRAA